MIQKQLPSARRRKQDATLYSRLFEFGDRKISIEDLCSLPPGPCTKIHRHKENFEVHCHQCYGTQNDPILSVVQRLNSRCCSRTIVEGGCNRSHIAEACPSWCSQLPQCASPQQHTNPDSLAFAVRLAQTYWKVALVAGRA